MTDIEPGRYDPIKAWSYSRFSNYTTCPAKILYGAVLRTPEKEPPSDAMMRGKRVHDAGEAWMKGDIDKLPIEFDGFHTWMHERRKAGAVPEQQWAFDITLRPVKDWFGPRVWLRMVIDLHNLRTLDDKTTQLDIVDYKTGREREEHQEQLSLYALGGFVKHRNVQSVRAAMWYLDSDTYIDAVYERSYFDALKHEWYERVSDMMHDRTFAATPNNLCGWCGWRKSIGGPCLHG